MARITIGADPEFFLETKSKSTLIPSQGRVPGTKDNPAVIDGTDFKVLRDNVAAEYNIPPATNKYDFLSSIETGMGLVLASIPYDKRKNIQISKKSSGLINHKHLNNTEALNFGCEPDFNAWTISENVIDRDSIDERFRCVGGHVHVGYLEKYPNINPLILVRCMDLFLGVPSVILDPDKERRKLYGKAGAYRPTKYGIEYRTLSNFWIHEPRFINFVWDNTITAISFAVSNDNIDPDSEFGYNIQEAINTSNKDLAYRVLSEVGAELEIRDDQVYLHFNKNMPTTKVKYAEPSESTVSTWFNSTTFSVTNTNV